jgi:hypothetical protein
VKATVGFALGKINPFWVGTDGGYREAIVKGPASANLGGERRPVGQLALLARVVVIALEATTGGRRVPIEERQESVEIERVIASEELLNQKR